MRPLDHQVLRMNSADGLTYEEIAALLGYSVKRVEQILARAIVGLERNLNDVQARSYSCRRGWSNFRRETR